MACIQSGGAAVIRAFFGCLFVYLIVKVMVMFYFAVVTYDPPVVMSEEAKQTLVQKCAPLYNIERAREWRECMGVGPK